MINRFLSVRIIGTSIAISAMVLAVATLREVKTPALTEKMASAATRFSVADRNGQPLSVSYQNALNVSDTRALHEVPDTLRRAIITAEDRRFFAHDGVDWRARIGALWQNMRALKFQRGASTITEQVVRILHPRPRSIWSRWIEGFEATLLEQKHSKGEILEFYLNQVPYAANRRGVAQAARYYFNRDLRTLTDKEMLALAIFPRAPTALDPRKRPDSANGRIDDLAQVMEDRGELSPGAAARMRKQVLDVDAAPKLLNTAHFITYIRETVPYSRSDNGTLKTSLDATLQQRVQTLMDERLEGLKRKKVHNGAALVVDHQSGEILTWVIAGAHSDAQISGSAIDAVRVPRQPGSSMKPFLYAMALDDGWSPATGLDDVPMSEAIGAGLHDFRNYSETFHGKISLRDALGNSLNIPALQTIAFVKPERYLAKLHALGISSLTKPASFYNDGLALGNGEVSLLEMVQGFSVLANKGTFRPLTPLVQASYNRDSKQVFSPEAASLIGNILSDPYARRKEFGGGSILNLPTQTAVKTGTSTDYRDAWVLGYNARYTVGIWFGNLDHEPMDGVTGSTGPALVLRSIFAELEARQQPNSLWLSPRLQQRQVCSMNKVAENCFPYTEYFMPDGSAPAQQSVASAVEFDVIRPTEGLHLAFDPRVPAAAQAFEFVAKGLQPGSQLEWILNGAPLSISASDRFLWSVTRGSHTLQVREVKSSGDVSPAIKVNFVVK
jgi:penicillin-binding protein 1C